MLVVVRLVDSPPSAGHYCGPMNDPVCSHSDPERPRPPRPGRLDLFLLFYSEFFSEFPLS